MCMWNVVFVASKDILKDKVLNALKLDISIYWNKTEHQCYNKDSAN